MTNNQWIVERKISAFVARKADEHPDIFVENAEDDSLSPAEVHTLQITYA